MYRRLALVLANGLDTLREGLRSSRFRSVIISPKWAENIGCLYGKLPKDRALSLYTKQDPKAAEESAFATRAALDHGRQVVKVDNTMGCSVFSGSADANGHTYLSAHEFQLRSREEALAILQDPQSLKDLMSCLQTGAQFCDEATADAIVDLRLVEKRYDYYFLNGKEMRKRDNEIRSDVGAVGTFAALLGGTDIVYITQHTPLTELSTGVLIQSWVAGTSAVHAMSGVLRWRIIWYPDKPNSVVVEFFGSGQSYWTSIDKINNYLVRKFFQQLVETLPLYQEWRRTPGDFKTFLSFLWSKDIGLYARRRVVRFGMAQKIGEIGNELLRDPDQFDAEEQNAKLAATAAAKRAWGLVPVITDVNDKSLTEDDPAATAPELPPTSDGRVPGIYSGTQRIQVDMASILGAPVTTCWAPEDHDQVAQEISKAMSSVMSESTLKEIQASVTKSGDAKLDQYSPSTLATPLDTVEPDKTTLLADVPTVIEGLIDHGVLDPALELLGAKQATVEATALANLQTAGFDKYPSDEMADSLRTVSRRAIHNASATGTDGFLMATLQTVAIKSQSAALSKNEVQPDVAKAKADLEQAKKTLETATESIDKVGADILAEIAASNLQNMEELNTLAQDSTTKTAESAKQEDIAVSAFMDKIKSDIKTEL